MRRQDFYYELPDELIARYPTEERRASRLLSIEGESGGISHVNFIDLLSKVQAGDLMVFNDTKVIPARVFGQKSTGGKVEILVERVLSKSECLAHIRASKPPKTGAELILEGGAKIRMEGREGPLFLLRLVDDADLLQVLEEVGHMPLPPYIDRPDEFADQERYQTVYAEKKGAVAAPTAGLHFDKPMLEALEAKGVELAFVTLHVGAGTFQPVRVDRIEEHAMHSELIDIGPEICERVKAVKKNGGRVIAVGTTSVRCLESAAARSDNSLIEPYTGDTDIFIYPGYEFKVVDCLLTNFHLPESTLMMLVSAFVGYNTTMQAYKEAVEQRYRFFSYGDAMFLTKNSRAAEQGPF